MKKLRLLGLTLIMLISLVACVASDANEKDNVLRVAMDLRYPPFETTTDDGKATGISVRIAEGLGEYLGREVEIVNTNFAEIIPALETGTVDIAIASMSITEGRKEKVDFTQPYFYFKMIGLLNNEYALKNNITGETPIDELWKIEDTKYVGIQSQISVSIPESKGFDVEEVADTTAAVLEVVNGTRDAFIMSASVVAGAYQNNQETTTILWSPVTASPIGMAVKKGANDELLAKANEYIGSLIESNYKDIKQEFDAVIEDQLGQGKNLDFYINEN